MPFWKKRRVTVDREACGPVQILVNEQIGPKRHMTPQGFLLCQDVPIARVGQMMYAPGETPVAPDPTSPHIVYIERDADELFADETMASLHGIPVTDNHPMGGVVTADNWQQLSRGHILNVRQGTEDDADVIIADVLIMNKQLIQSVLAGKREVSLGYSAEYAQLSPGRGRQSAIIGNHLALVEKGRCGPRCAIGDHQSQLSTENAMPAERKTLPLVKRPVNGATLRRALAIVADAMPDDDDDGNGDDTMDSDLGDKKDGVHIHMHAATSSSSPALPVPTKDERLDKLEAAQEETKKTLDAISANVQKVLDAQTVAPAKKEEKEVVTVDESTVTQDSAALETSFNQLLADVEVLVPGFSFPTFDAAAKRATTVDAMCTTRRKVLETLATTADGKTLLENVGSPDFNVSKADCASTAIMFRAAAGAQRMANNAKNTNDADKLGTIAKSGLGTIAGPAKTIAEMNKANRERFGNK